MRRLLVLLLLFTGGCAPYMVTRDFRGDNTARAFYIYPPGSRPWRTVRAAEVATRQQCSATRHTTTSFELTYRTQRGVRTAVIRDAGNVPASKAAFDLELESLLTNSCLEAAERERLTAKLWARMPRTFADDLLGRYGFDSRRGQVDLVPGMRLRVEWQAYAANLQKGEENSYIGTGTSWWSVAAPPGNATQSFEPLFGWSDAGPRHPEDSLEVIAGLSDLEATDLRRRFYRLLYPKQNGFSSALEGKIEPKFRAVIVAANDRETLKTLTDDYRSGACDRATSATSGLCRPFAGRTIPIPELEVRLRGERTWISVGTTLRQIMSRDGRTFRPSSRELPVQRVYGSDFRPVVVDEHELLDPALLDLPLVKGDRIEW